MVWSQRMKVFKLVYQLYQCSYHKVKDFLNLPPQGRWNTDTDTWNKRSKEKIKQMTSNTVSQSQKMKWKHCTGTQRGKVNILVMTLVCSSRTLQSQWQSVNQSTLSWIALKLACSKITYKPSIYHCCHSSTDETFPCFLRW